MQNIKNFRPVLPSVEDAKKLGDAVNSIQFLMSEDGQDWYECQSQFAGDTIKFMYDENGVIRSLVDKPVRERGNTLAVSMFFPLNHSVAEVAPEDFPEGVTIDGAWMFDGVNITPCPQAKEAKAPTTSQKIDELRTELAELKELLTTK